MPSLSLGTHSCDDLRSKYPRAAATSATRAATLHCQASQGAIAVQSCSSLLCDTRRLPGVFGGWIQAGHHASALRRRHSNSIHFATITPPWHFPLPIRACIHTVYRLLHLAFTHSLHWRFPVNFHSWQYYIPATRNAQCSAATAHRPPFVHSAHGSARRPPTHCPCGRRANRAVH